MKNKDPLEVMVELFSVFFYVAAFTVGGGVAMVPILDRILVAKKHYLSEKEFREIFSVSQVVPGSTMICMATFAGYKIRGFWGSLAACVAVMLPPLAIITLISIYYAQFMQFALMEKLMLGILAGVVGEISGIILKMFLKTKFDIFKTGLLLFSFALMFYFKVNPIYAVLIGALAGITFGQMEE